MYMPGACDLDSFLSRLCCYVAMLVGGGPGCGSEGKGQPSRPTQ